MTVSEIEGVADLGEGRSPAVQRLLVTRQDEQRMYRPVGCLEATTGAEGIEYTFAYLQVAVDDPAFQSLLGFKDTHRRYHSRGLFPLFAERLMDPRRPDRSTFLAALDLSPDASPLTILARSGGHRVGDQIELLPLPAATADGTVACTFLVHGIRYVEGAEERIDALQQGDVLLLEEQPDNPANPEAVLVMSHEPHGRLGWVPNAMASAVRQLGERGVVVVKVNGPEVGPRFRLLVRLSGRAEPGWAPFTGPEWRTTA